MFVAGALLVGVLRAGVEVDMTGADREITGSKGSSGRER